MGFITAFGVLGVMVSLSILDKWAIALVGLLPLASWVLEIRADVFGANLCGGHTALSRALRRSRSYNWFLGLFLLFGAVLSLAYSDQLSLLRLVFVSYALSHILPTHPPTLVRRWILSRLCSYREGIVENF